MTKMTQDELRAQCLHIAETIEGKHWDEIDWEDGCEGSAFDYFENNLLDVKYIIGSDRKTVLGAELMVAFGGPTIWIDTYAMTVEGRWWGESASVKIVNDALGLEEFVETLWAC